MIAQPPASHAPWTAVPTVPTRSRPPMARASAPAIPPWYRRALGVVLLLAGVFDGAALGQTGYPNLYDAATVRSMLTGSVGSC